MVPDAPGTANSAVPGIGSFSDAVPYGKLIASTTSLLENDLRLTAEGVRIQREGGRIGGKYIGRYVEGIQWGAH